MDLGDQNIPETTAREKKGGVWDTLLIMELHYKNVVSSKR